MFLEGVEYSREGIILVTRVRSIPELLGTAVVSMEKLWTQTIHSSIGNINPLLIIYWKIEWWTAIYIMSIYETISIYARKSFFSSSNPKNWGSEQSIMSREEYDKLATSSHSISMRLHAVIRYKYMEGPLFAECYPMETSGFWYFFTCSTCQ